MDAETQAMFDRLDRAERLQLGPKWARVAHRPMSIAVDQAVCLVNRFRRITVPAAARTFYGERMRVYLPEMVSQSIYRDGVFEPDLTQTVVRVRKPGSIVYDIGAHFGYFSLLMSRLVGVHGEVHAFEPTPSTRRVLAHNMRRRPNVRVVDRAAWSTEAELTFHDFGIAHSAFNSAFDPRGEGFTQSTEHQVKAVTLDAYAAEVGPPDFVKIDAESAESYVIAGMVGLLDSSRPLVTVEVGDYDLPGVPSSREMIQRILDHSYTVAQATDIGFAEAAPLDRYGYANVLLVPHERVQPSSS